ncbi:hypothetical protein BGZ54_006077 [Gamsiella multidivaricata]|nr:hypothetical protein BGZ54_006077 [Gamsiella multidivaricata]
MATTASSGSTTSSSSTHSAISTVPVLIAGGGPVGLFEAYLLTKLGIQVRIIEREMAISPLSKALGLQARSMEIFQMAGIVDKFLERGTKLKDFNIYIGNRKAATIPVMGVSAADTQYGFGLFLEQAKTSEILVEELEKMGVKVDHGWELLDTKVVEESEEEGIQEASVGEKRSHKQAYVETIIRRALSGDNTTVDEKKVLGDVDLLTEQTDKVYETQVIRSEYLVAADGGRSTVRHKLNIGFPGRTLTHKTLMWDGKYESDMDFSGVTLVHGVDRKNVIAFPLTNGSIRMGVEGGSVEPGEDLAKTAQDLTVERFEELVSTRIAPAKFKITETDWLTVFKINERRAEHFVYKNRIFLAGDAAHVHSPAGGQGLNTGLQDAHNLAWKLAFVLNKVAPPSLLQTYEEREPMADRAIELSSMILNRNRNLGFMSMMKRRVFYFLSPLIFSLQVRYQPNALNKNHATQPVLSEKFQVGVRAYDCTLHSAQSASSSIKDSTQIRLHELTIGIGRFHILVFTSDMLAVKDTSAINGIERTHAKELENNINNYVRRWRSKWSFNSSMTDGYQDKDLFKVHIIAGSATAADEEDEDSSSLDTLIKKNAGDGKIFLDDTKVGHQRYGFLWNKGPGGIVVVRPDSHIGYRVNGAGEDAWKDVDEFFSSILAL